MTIDTLFDRAGVSTVIMAKSLESRVQKILPREPYNFFDDDLIVACTISSELAGTYAGIS